MDDARFVYSPGWQVDAVGADPAEPADPWQQPAGVVNFEYTGQDLALALAEGDYWAYLLVTVDGQPANQLPVLGRCRGLPSPLRAGDADGGRSGGALADRASGGGFRSPRRAGGGVAGLGPDPSAGRGGGWLARAQIARVAGRGVAGRRRLGGHGTLTTNKVVENRSVCFCLPFPPSRSQPYRSGCRSTGIGWRQPWRQWVWVLWPWGYGRIFGLSPCSVWAY